MIAKTKTDDLRRRELAMIHMAAKKLFGDVSRGGDSRADYEDWLERRTERRASGKIVKAGKRSAGKLTANERATLVAYIREGGLIPERGRGGTGPDRPSSAQWGRIAALSRKMGWRGLEDERLRGFVRRTAKVDNPRFISRAQATKVISGLEKWVKSGGGDALP